MYENCHIIICCCLWCKKKNVKKLVFKQPLYLPVGQVQSRASQVFLLLFSGCLLAQTGIYKGLRSLDYAEIVALLLFLLNF